MSCRRSAPPRWRTGSVELVGADLGVATTGVAGPDPQEGKPVGLVYVAVADGSGAVVEELSLAGDRAAIRLAAVEAALGLLVRRVAAGAPRKRRPVRENRDGKLSGAG